MVEGEYSASVLFGDARLPASLWERVYPLEDGCWIWVGPQEARGYGNCVFRGRTRRVHRVFFLELVGPTEEEALDHLCRRPSCVNPAHLEPCSKAENTRRGLSTTHATCRSGRHAWTPENTIRRRWNGRIDR